MRNSIALAIVVVMSLARSGHAATLEEILAKNLAARGGEAKIKEIRTLKVTGRLVIDGHEGWSIPPFGGRLDAEKASADDARGFAQQAEIDGPLIDWRIKGHKIEYLGTEDTDGTPAITLRVTRKDGDLQYVYLDPDSYLEIRIKTVHKVRGAEQITEADYGGYQQVGGVWFPFAIESGPPGAPRQARILVERAEINVPAEDSWFKVPPPKVRVASVIAPG